MPSAIVFISDSGDRAALRQRFRVRRGALRLYADDPDLGAQRLHRDRDAGQQSAAAGRHQHGLHVGRLLDDLQADGALSGHDVEVVERVDEDRAGLRLVGPRGLEGVLEVAALEDHLGAVPPRGLLLGDRRALGHEHGGVDAEQLGRQRDALRMVAGRRRHHAAGALLLREPRDPGVGAAGLERAGALEVLALEVDRAADQRRQPPRLLHRRLDRDSPEQLPGRLDVGERDVSHRWAPRRAGLPRPALSRLSPRSPRPAPRPDRPRGWCWTARCWTTALAGGGERHGHQGPGDATDQHAAAEGEDHAERVHRDPPAHQERLQDVALDLLDQDHAAEHQQRGDRPLVDQRDEHRHAAGHSGTDEWDERAEEDEHAEREHERDAAGWPRRS